MNALMRKRTIQRIAAVTAAFGMCISFVSGSYAAWQISGDTDNILTMASCKNEIVEQYEQPDHVDPSEEISKVVNISNTGDIDTIVRVSVDKQFGDKGDDGGFEADTSLNPEMILIEYNTAFWMEKDGWFYYKGVLKAGETTKEPLMTSYTLSKEAGNEYKGKSARILVRMEAVQAEGEAVSVWNTTYRELDITVPQAPAEKETKVTFCGKESGFDITKNRADLFANFKDLLPGCARTQTIRICNESGKDVEICLRAEAANQERMTESQLKLVSEMLRKYAMIEVHYEDTIVYRGPVSGNLTGSGNTMKNNISLGRFKSGTEKALTVKLELKPEMDNRYETLTGKVKWVFSAGGDDQDITTDAIYPAKTGIVKNAIVSFGLFFFFMIMGAVNLVLYKREKQ